MAVIITIIIMVINRKIVDLGEGGGGTSRISHRRDGAQWRTAAKRKAAAEATSAAARGIAAAPAAEVGLGAGASAAETAEMAATARTARMARALDPAAAIASIRWLVVGGGGGEKVLEGGGIMERERGCFACARVEVGKGVGCEGIYSAGDAGSLVPAGFAAATLWVVFFRCKT